MPKGRRAAEKEGDSGKLKYGEKKWAVPAKEEHWYVEMIENGFPTLRNCLYAVRFSNEIKNGGGGRAKARR